MAGGGGAEGRAGREAAAGAQHVIAAGLGGCAAKGGLDRPGPPGPAELGSDGRARTGAAPPPPEEPRAEPGSAGRAPTVCGMAEGPGVEGTLTIHIWPRRSATARLKRSTACPCPEGPELGVPLP